MKKKYTSSILTLFAILTFTNIALSHKLDLRQIDIQKFKEKCNTRFCRNGNDVSCNEKVKNLELLANFIKLDNRVTNIGVASFFFATVYTETGIKNLNPTEEVGKGKGTNYGNPDEEAGQTYYGISWVPLTHKGIYKKAMNILGIDFLNKPNLLLKPKNAYERMYLFTINGWLETYRTSASGAGGRIPIKLTDFLDEKGNLDYNLTRAVINANAIGKTPKRFEFKKGCYIPTYEFLDASKKNKDLAIFFENALRYTLGADTTNSNVVKLLPLIEHGGTPGAGCFIQDKENKTYCQLLADEVYFNINNVDEKYEEIKDKKSYPKGYTYGFKNTDITIYIREIPLKKEGCLTTAKYEILIIFKNKKYKQKLDGFCGC